MEDSDVEDGTYIPLERPDSFNPPSLVHMQIQDELSDEGSAQESSGSESDEEPRRRPKRTKLRPKRPQPHAQPDKKEKYNIWCKALQASSVNYYTECRVLELEQTVQIKIGCYNCHPVIITLSTQALTPHA